VEGYDASGITLRFFAWVDQGTSDLGKVRSEAIHAVRTRLADAGIATPRNIQYSASIDDAAPPASPSRSPRAGGDAVADTSVNHELDAHLAAEQQAHASEDLLPVESGGPEAAAS